MFISFDLLCSYRWLEVIGKTLRDLHNQIIQEWGDFDKNAISKSISNRQSVTKQLFYFERFKTEMIDNRYRSRGSTKFMYLHKMQDDLFGILIKRIDKAVESLTATTKSINEYSNTNLDLKNIKYNTIIQKQMIRLTYIIMVFGILQIILIGIQIYLSMNQKGSV
jgi:hypothetical protein